MSLNFRYRKFTLFFEFPSAWKKGIDFAETGSKLRFRQPSFFTLNKDCFVLK